MRPGTRAIAAGAVIVVSAAVAQPAAEPAPRAGAARLMSELMNGQVASVVPFALPDQHGRRVGPRDWRGRAVLLYFGYLYCPDVCPTDLRAIADAIDVLGVDGAKVQPVFVTLDPGRDTPEIAGRYATAFHRSFTALRGSEAETRDLAEAYKVYFEKVALPGGNYTIDHTAFIYVLDTEGRYVGYFPRGTSGARIAAFVRTLLPPAASPGR